MKKFVSKHIQLTPQRFDGLKFPPAKQGWTTEYPTANQSIRRVKSLRLSDGTSIIFRQLSPRKVSKAAQAAMRLRAAAVLAEAIVDTEKMLVRQPRKTRRARKRKTKV